MSDQDPSALTAARSDRFIVGLLIFTATVFVLGIAFFIWRDHNATSRCHDRGGKTWDQGQHCVLPSGRVVNTHDRIWP